MTNERLCLHEEVERNYFKTECGAYYPHDDETDEFIFCPFCGGDIESEVEDE